MLACISHQPSAAEAYAANLLRHFGKSDLAVLKYSFALIFRNSSHLHPHTLPRDEVGEKCRLGFSLLETTIALSIASIVLAALLTHLNGTMHSIAVLTPSIGNVHEVPDWSLCSREDSSLGKGVLRCTAQDPEIWALIN